MKTKNFLLLSLLSNLIPFNGFIEARFFIERRKCPPITKNCFRFLRKINRLFSQFRWGCRMPESNMVYWKDEERGEIRREKISFEKTSYDLGTLGAWEPVIADERVEVKKGEEVTIRVKEIKIPPHCIIMPCSFQRHAMGYVQSVGAPGKPKKIEEDREINKAIFSPVMDGVIEEEDLLTVLNLLYARPKIETSRSESKWRSRQKIQP